MAGFPVVPPWFRRAFPATPWGARANARITPAFFGWLVGPAAVGTAVVDGVESECAVKVERCR